MSRKKGRGWHGDSAGHARAARSRGKRKGDAKTISSIAKLSGQSVKTVKRYVALRRLGIPRKAASFTAKLVSANII